MKIYISHLFSELPYTLDYDYFAFWTLLVLERVIDQPLLFTIELEVLLWVGVELAVTAVVELGVELGVVLSVVALVVLDGAAVPLLVVLVEMLLLLTELTL